MHDLVVVINLDQHSLFVAQRHKLSSTHDTTEPHTPAPPNVINAASKKQARKQAGPQTHGGTRSMISALVARLTGFLSHQAPLRLSMGPADSAGASVSSAIPEGAERCTVAAGCFWGTEHLYRRHFGGKGLLDARVGYIGGDVDDPSYRAVCGGKTGRAFPFPPPLAAAAARTDVRTDGQTQKPRKSYSTPRSSRTASCSSSSTASTTPRRSTARARTPGPSTAPQSTSTARSRSASPATSPAPRTNSGGRAPSSQSWCPRAAGGPPRTITSSTSTATLAATSAPVISSATFRPCGIDGAGCHQGEGHPGKVTRGRDTGAVK